MGEVNRFLYTVGDNTNSELKWGIGNHRGAEKQRRRFMILEISPLLRGIKEIVYIKDM